MGITSFICDSFHSIGTWLFSSLDENYKLKILLAKYKKVLTFLLLAFFNLKIHYLVNGKFKIIKNLHYFRLYFEMRGDDTEQSIK